MIKVLFVCLGNICRSPLAEGVMKDLIKKKGLSDKISIDSCGTSKYHIGEQPDKRTVANARENGIPLDHQARQFEQADFRRFDYILAMDSANLECVQRLDMTKEFGDKLYLMRHFDPENKDGDVPDPYFGGEEGFQHVFEIVNRSVVSFLGWLKEKHKIS